MSNPYAEDGRDTLIHRLRAMATWLEANPGIPLSPHVDITIYYFSDTLDEARDAMAAAPGDWDKQTSARDNYITYGHAFRDDSNRWTVAYQLHVRKGEATACTRVQVGIEHVEAHDKPVYEWQCDS